MSERKDAMIRNYTRVVKNYVLTGTDIRNLEVDMNDDWQFPFMESDPDVMLNVKRNFEADELLERFAQTLGMTMNAILEADGYLDMFAQLDVINETVKCLYIIGRLPDEDVDAYLYFDLPDMGKLLYRHLYNDSDESYRMFIEECKERLRLLEEMKKEEKKEEMKREKERENQAKETRENFIEALNIFQKAFENLAYYAGSIYIDDEWWDGDDNYPFEWSFEEMPGNVEIWVEAIKGNIKKAQKPIEKFVTNYSKEADRTFIMKCTYKGDDCIREECVGFYAGEPNEEDTKHFCNGKLVAEYNWD